MRTKPSSTLPARTTSAAASRDYTNEDLGRLAPAEPVSRQESDIADDSAWRELERQHSHALRSADVAFRAWGFDRPAQAAALRQLSDTWASYLAEYERVAHDAGRGADDVAQVLELSRRLHQQTASVDIARGVMSVRSERSESVHDKPSLGAVPRAHPPHHIVWLPPGPRANADQLELYAWTSLPPEYLPTHGLSTADDFVLAQLDGGRLAARVRSGYLLRLEAAAATAIALSEYSDNLPAAVLQRVRESPDTFLLPATWLSRVKVKACHEVHHRGTLGPAVQPARPDLIVAFRGADHGVAGLPSGAVRWPARRKAALAFILLPDDPEWIRARLAAFPGWLPLTRQRPNRAHGYRVFEIEVPGRSVIDVAATLATYADAPLAESSLAPFAGVDLVLPARAFGDAIIVKAHRAGHWEWRTPTHPMDGRSLAEALPTS